MSPGTRSLLVVALVSALPLLGMMLLSAKPEALTLHVSRLSPFAAGALLGAAFLHLVPEALHHNSVPAVATWVAAGAFGFLVVDRALHARLGLSPATAVLGPSSAGGTFSHGAGNSRLKDLLPLLVLGDALHNGLDGMLVSATYLNTPALGVVTGAAVALHELPRELGTFVLMVAAGLSARQAMGLNVISAGIAMAGAIVTLMVGENQWIAGGALGAIAAGTFVYLAGALATNELRQDVKPRDRAWQLALAIAGVMVTAVGIPRH